MNKSNKTFSLSASVFVFVSFFIAPMSVVNADVTISGITKIQMCGDFLAAEEKEKEKGKDGKDEEEPDCE